jgi:hypothetical protein
MLVSKRALRAHVGALSCLFGAALAASPAVGAATFASERTEVTASVSGGDVASPVITTATPYPKLAATTTAATAGSLSFASGGYTVAQDTGSVQLTIRRTGGSSAKIAVNYATVGSGAVAGTDFTSQSGTLRWARGDLSARTISIAIGNATPFTGSKSFMVGLSGPSGGAALGTPSATTVTINGSGSATPPPPPPPPPPPTGSTQPYIQDYSPSSGPAGTVVTLNGSGFAGLTSAWIGSAHDVPVSVLSDTQVRVTVPASATTGSIGLFSGSLVSVQVRPSHDATFKAMRSVLTFHDCSADHYGPHGWPAWPPEGSLPLQPWIAANSKPL